MSDVECPYCGAEQAICYDDSHGYAEDQRHEQSCGECEKTFVFATYLSLSHEAYKADCLNAGKHDWRLSRTFPREFSYWQCKDCEQRQKLTAEEKQELISAEKS